MVNVATSVYIARMRTVGIRELKNRLSEFLRHVRSGERILVTDRGVVVAQLGQPSAAAEESSYPALLAVAREGKARLGAENRPELYEPLEPLLEPGEAARLLEAERGSR